MDISARRGIVLASFFCFFPVLFFILEYFLQTSWAFLGIYPRTIHGLTGLLFAPLIHADIAHLMANLLPLWLAMFGIFVFYPNIALRVLFFNAFFTSFLVWLIARPNIHIGTSGVLYGLNAFLLFSGLIRWEKRALTFAMVVLTLNQGIILGMLPTDTTVSYESHISGFCIGIAQAFVFRHKDLPVIVEDTTIEEENEDNSWDYKPYTIEGKESSTEK